MMYNSFSKASNPKRSQNGSTDQTGGRHLLEQTRTWLQPNKFNHWSKYTLLLAALLLIACSTQMAAEEQESGRVLLWHSWQGEEATALQTLLDRFHDVYPHIDVIAAPYSAADLIGEFSDHATQGLGPDILLGDQLWAPQLAEAGFIRAVSEDEVDFSRYLSSAVSTLRYENKVYGIPLSVHTSALFYNTSQVDVPPETLDSLLEHAENGKKVGLNSNFVSAVWGIHAFGGELVNEQGKIILEQGGFSNWLDWLLEAQNMPNMVISNDQSWLFQQFSSTDLAYYVGRSSELLQLQEQLGSEQVGVAPLPAGPNADAGPFLQSEALFFSTASSKEQMQRALLLAEFLTNEEQQRKLAQLAGRIPANSQVRIDRRISPAVAGFVEQSKTAIPFRLLPQYFDVARHGNDAYMQTLEGLVDSTIAAGELTVQINQQHGFPSDIHLTKSTTNNAKCNKIRGMDLLLWHGWEDQKAGAIKKTIDSILGDCPAANVNIVAKRLPELVASYQANTSADGKADQRLGRTERQPDLLVMPHSEISELAQAGLIQNLDALIEPTFLQRYAPAAAASMRTDGDLYGLPLAINTTVLYFNREKTSELPRVLGDLLSTVSPETQLAMAYMPSYKTHWGIAGFGGKLFNAESEMTIEGQGFEEWLLWLKDAQDTPGVHLYAQESDAVNQFLAGEAAYLVADGTVLPTVLAKLGTDVVGTLPLPAGPAGPASPVMVTEGLAINVDSSHQEFAIALAKELSSVDSQTMLMASNALIPANMTISNASHEAIEAFWEQAKTATALPNIPESHAVMELGDMIYTNVLEKNEPPDTVLAKFSDFIETINRARKGQEAEENALVAAREECTIAGKLLVAPERVERATSALEQVAASLVRACPNIRPTDGAYGGLFAASESWQQEGTNDEQ